MVVHINGILLPGDNKGCRRIIVVQKSPEKWEEGPSDADKQVGTGKKREKRRKKTSRSKGDEREERERPVLAEQAAVQRAAEQGDVERHSRRDRRTENVES